MRVFVAIELPEGVRVHLRQVQDRLKRQVASASWTRLENLHLTLKFLGEVQEQQIPQITDVLKEIASSPPVPVPAAAGAGHAPAEAEGGGGAGGMEMWAYGLNCFPQGQGAIRIVAAAFRGQYAPLRAMYDTMEDRFAQMGVPKDGRAYRPHATLARPRALLPGSARTRLESVAAQSWPGPKFPVNEFVLMESRQRHEGSEYIALARFPLK